MSAERKVERVAGRTVQVVDTVETVGELYDALGRLLAEGRRDCSVFVSGRAGAAYALVRVELVGRGRGRKPSVVLL